MLEPTFTLESEEQVWRVSLSQGGRERPYELLLTCNGDGTVTLSTGGKPVREFKFIMSDPNVVLAIGRLFIAAARKAGATDA